jgi:hypothetical protein
VRKLAVRTLMRGTWMTLVTGLLIAGSLTTPATAATLEWAGTLTVAMSGSAPFLVNETGVATINGSAGLGHLNTLRLPGGFSSTVTLPLTDPDIPDLVSLRVIERLTSATLALFSGGPPLSQGVMPMTGTAKLCLVFPGCGIATTIPLTVGGTRGVGIGGTITTTTLFYHGTFWLQGAPWTIGTAEVITASGAYTTVGFVHGPASNTSSTAQVGGAVNLVTPTLITTTLGPQIPVLSSLRLRFIPEPGELLLLGTGLGLLATLAHRRARG